MPTPNSKYGPSRATPEYKPSTVLKSQNTPSTPDCSTSINLTLISILSVIAKGNRVINDNGTSGFICKLLS
ncbi:MAG: hypothetical protein KJ711_04255, partial [Candidatus Omnitrophica bacterium]|nr:hypothetical protein [Candidatus Omnitrophota bacterium]